MTALLTDQRPSAARRVGWRRLFMAGAVIAAAVAVGAEAKAGPSAANLYDVCREARGSADHAYCVGYVAGVMGAMFNGDPDEVRRWRVCPTPNSWYFKVFTQDSDEALVDIVMRFIDAHPEMRRWEVTGVIAQALIETFPCK